MVEIRFGDQYEVTDLAGQTIHEAREQFKSDFGIPDKAKARLNGSKVKSSAEVDTIINDDDQLSFAVSRSRTPFLIGALLLALAATGGVFAFGFVNANVSLNATTSTSDFATVTPNTSVAGTWKVVGLLKKNILTAEDLFYITKNPDYTGDLVITVTLGNVGDLAKMYRAFGLELILVDSNNNTLDIGVGTESMVLLSLDYPSVNIFYSGSANTTKVRVKNGFYVATHFGSRAGSASPDIFCDVAQSEY